MPANEVPSRARVACARVLSIGALLSVLALAACSDDGGPASTTGPTTPPPDATTDPTGAASTPASDTTGGGEPASTAPAAGSDPPTGGAGQGAAEPPVAQPGDDSAGDHMQADDPEPTTNEPSGSAFPPVTDLSEAGPFAPATTPSSGPGGGYTIFHPEELGQDGLLHPILTWGNGATTVPALFALLPHLASHGFVIIASNNPFVTGAELIAGIDWLFDENGRDGSPFFGKLDTQNVASFGYSLGSLGTFEIADDPRLTTTVHISGGAMDKSVVPNLKNPAAFFCGNASDIANGNCESDFELATVPVFYGVFPGDHLGILASHTVQINEAVAGWLRWRLMHDDSLESMFVGPSCTLCQDARWTVKQKDFDVAP